MKHPLPWADHVDPADFDAAVAYLSLRWTPDIARPIIDSLRDTPISTALPGDLLRAGRVDALPLHDAGVVREIRRILFEGHIGPVLIINLEKGLEIADGYHRISLAYGLAPFEPMPAVIA